MGKIPTPLRSRRQHRTAVCATSVALGSFCGISMLSTTFKKNTEEASLEQALEVPRGATEEAAGPACSELDQYAINGLGAGHDEGSFPQTTSECATQAFNLFHGIEENSFNQCMVNKIPVSTKCSSCFAGAASYGLKNCKMACMRNWCSQSCLACTKGYDIIGCAGFAGPQPTPCDDDATVEEGPQIVV
eukprot:TRINITY_DN32622_c0_g1_i2.p1 TRINITY_DN32622_c0_g1~~TRINITY_DN32622_c0_g1_i2.p1  ORF type:complete len:189 (-),score=23.17 TRINITY_DN32622_c0_g1_i2:335-901(-)